MQFDASTPLEDIHAVNNKVSAILNPETGEVAVLLLQKEFKFKRRLMQEHFNENYMESDSFPKGIFKGFIQDYPQAGISTDLKSILKGTLSLHGITREITVPVELSKAGGAIVLKTSFVVESEEYGIKVPKVLFKKVAREVSVTGEFKLQPDVR